MKIHLKVLDLTPYEFNNDTITLLMKGLSFTPTPPSKEANLREDFADFTRKLRLKEYFIDKNYQSEDIVRPKSEFAPQSGRVPELDDIASEIETMKIKEKKFKDNLSKSERKALNELLHNNEIVIKQADKCGTVVIMTKKYYHEMVMEHLLDHSTYTEPNEEDPDKKVMEIIKEYADEYTLPDVLTEKENEYISEFSPTSSKFYCLPKIHKSKEIEKIMEERPADHLKMPEPPNISGRPIVGGPNCPTNKLSNLILKPLVFKVRSYVKDSFHFLEMLPRNVDFESTFVTFDVSSLYTNISHDLALEAISYWIDKHPEDLVESRFSKEFVMKGIELILTLNYFVFDDKCYLQIKGVAMGTKVAVVLAYLIYLDIKLYIILPNYFSNDYCLCIIKWRKSFIDDCFILWKKSENLQLFEELLNTLHPLIKFTKKEGDANIPFLDILVIKTEQGTTETDIFYKKTNAHRYFVSESAHPHKTKRNIPLHTSQKNHQNCIQ